jgi:hypothetical protein
MINFSLAVGSQPQQLTVSGYVNEIDSTTSTVSGLVSFDFEEHSSPTQTRRIN